METDMETVAETEEKVPDAKPAKPKKEKKVKTAKKPKNGISKKTAKKPKNGASKKTAAAKSNQGQSGPTLELGVDKMNKNEVKIVKGIFTKSGERKPHTIKELQSLIGGKSTSPARNALRRLVRAGWIEHTILATDDKNKKRGVYRLTEKGRKRGVKEA